MEDNKFRSETTSPDESGPPRNDREEMEREIEELAELIEEGNKLFGLPPLSELD